MVTPLSHVSSEGGVVDVVVMWLCCAVLASPFSKIVIVSKNVVSNEETKNKNIPTAQNMSNNMF